MNEERDKKLIPCLVLEEYLKNMYLEDIKKIDEFLSYISSYFRVKKEEIRFHRETGLPEENRCSCIAFEIPLKNKNFYKILIKDNGNIKNDLMVVQEDLPTFTRWKGTGKNIKLLIFEKNKKSKEFFDYFLTQFKYWKGDVLKYTGKLRYESPTDNSEFLLKVETLWLNHIVITITDKNGKDLFCKKIKADTEEQFVIKYNGVEEKYTREQFIKILNSLQVDISLFEEQEQINKFYEEKMKQSKPEQTDSVKQAYQNLKEIAEILKDKQNTEEKFEGYSDHSTITEDITSRKRK